MIFQSGGLGKTFATVLAFVWFLARVNAHVRFKVPGLSEGLGAVWALKWLLASMDSHVNLKTKTFRKT